jgi:hypothetical protein
LYRDDCDVIPIKEFFCIQSLKTLHYYFYYYSDYQSQSHHEGTIKSYLFVGCMTFDHAVVGHVSRDEPPMSVHQAQTLLAAYHTVVKCHAGLFCRQFYFIIISQVGIVILAAVAFAAASNPAAPY